MTRIAGATTVITGAASGIGRLIALGMDARGATVVAWDIDQDGLDRLAAETDGRIRGYACDVSDRRSIYRTAERVRSDVGSVDILVNNAGVVSGNPLLEIPDEKIEATFAINVLSLYWATKALLPDMIDRGAGHVVTIASAAGLIGVARQTDYSASKFAAVGFDESLRNELRQRAPGVKTTVVCPYFIDTGMFEGVQTRFSWLLPILQPQPVVDRVLRAVERDRRRLYMPPMVYLVPAMRVLPVPLFDRIADFFGVNKTMDKFRGRTRVEDVEQLEASSGSQTVAR
jgi:all-trans-retinol dehydrogenase (NAD+)